MSETLAWRVEQACLDAWPALRSAMRGDWLLRFGEGVSRRANSVNPLHDRATSIAAYLDDFAALYRHHGQPLIVRVPTLLAGAAQINRELDQHGFGSEGETCTLLRDFGGERLVRDASATASPAVDASAPDTFAAANASAASGISIKPRPDADWLAAIARLQAQSPSHAAIYARVIDAIALPAGFAALRHDGRIAATAYGVLHGDLLVVESVVVDAALRGRGLGRRLMHAVFAWAISHGAKAACLQVVADNMAGHALYASLGFDHELYRYHYRRPATN
ncbi:GNAT family N-acetyltransferase [Rhodopseudomonas palustris]|uniref:GNAT family N-acetyltransferase n=1 Tax=Rhodopseudomonas palustris TaxID=1076 RepID=A0A418VKJ9_RHOPL|nr:GNAT family N-acetyltransferase [Rhodopseudomonas palustris]RJF76676.1 GNAT family N-acetyltransferase [Rhodopseudomonas palustris]